MKENYEITNFLCWKFLNPHSMNPVNQDELHVFKRS